MVEAYILIQTDVGKSADVAAAIAEIPGVIKASPVTGPYDAVVNITADDVDALGKLVVNRIHSIDGITRTLTCPVLNI